MRLVSLVPSITETLLAWGADVVACTRFCEQPHLPHVGGTKDPQIDTIVALAPDLVLLDREENRREDAEALQAAGIRLHVTHVTSVDDVAPMLEALSVAIGRRVLSDAAASADDAQQWVVAGERLRAFVPIWRRPWMAIGRATYGASLLAQIGIDVVTADGDAAYPTVPLEEAALLGAQLVLLPSEPYPFTQRHIAEVAAAVAPARVVLIDGQDLFWWGVRTPAALARIRASLREVSRPRCAGDG